MARPESSVGRFNNSPKWVKAVIGVMSATAILAACSSQPNTEPVSAETSISTTDQGDQNTNNQATVILSEKIDKDLSIFTPEQQEFAVSSYAGPDSLGPSLISNEEEFNQMSGYKGKPDNWQATLMSKINGGNIDIIQSEVNNFSLTQEALEGYREQCAEALEDSKNNNGGITPDFTKLTNQDSINGNWYEAKTMHIVAFLETIDLILELAQKGEITLPNESKLENKGTTFDNPKYVVTNKGVAVQNPILIEVGPNGEILVGKEGGATKKSTEIHWVNKRDLTPYSTTSFNAVNEQDGTVFLFGNFNFDAA